MRRTTFRLALVACLAAAAPSAAADDGFTPLFNGKNLDGWKTKTGESLDGKTEAAGGRFKVADGALVIDQKVKGDVTIFTARTFGADAHFKFEFRPETGCNNDLYVRGLKFDVKKEDVKNLKWGEWNELEIVVAGDSVEFKCNGESIRTAKTKPGATPLGVRAELGPMRVRKLRVKAGS